MSFIGRGSTLFPRRVVTSCSSYHIILPRNRPYCTVQYTRHSARVIGATRAPGRLSAGASMSPNDVAYPYPLSTIPETVYSCQGKTVAGRRFTVVTVVIMLTMCQGQGRAETGRGRGSSCLTRIMRCDKLRRVYEIVARVSSIEWAERQMTLSQGLRSNVCLAESPQYFRETGPSAGSSIQTWPGKHVRHAISRREEPFR